MAPRNIVSKRRRPPPKDEPRTQLSKQSDELTDSDSDGEAAPLVPPKKPKFASPLKLPGTEPVESGSACSSPSISGFIIAPRAEETMKGKGGAEAKTKSKSKSKLKSKGKGGSSSKGKVFSEDDVISLLKGLAVFWANGRNNKWAEFHLFISDDLGNQFTRTQVSEKIRTLKNKFDRNLERARANGGRLDLSDPHELTVFELSKALWGDEKAEKGENVDEDEQEKGENGDGDEQEKVENGDGDEQEKVENGDGDEQEKVENGDEEQVDVERDEGRKKKRKKRKQVSENGGENGKSEKPELRVEELVEEGDLRDAANTILSISNLVFENGEGIKKSKKKKKKKKRSKESEELDERKESVKEDVQVEANDEGNKTSSKEEQVDRGSERNKKKSKKKKKKTKLVNECLEENKPIGEQKEVDELAEKSMKQVDEEEEEEEEELSKEGKQVDELAEKSMKQVDEEEEEELSKEGKQVDELAEKSMKQVDEEEEEEEEEELAEKSMKQVDEEEEEEELSKEGKVDEHEKHEKRPKKKKRIDGRDKKKGIAEPVDGHGEENCEPAKEKQEMAIEFNEFRSAYPLLYASFNTPGIPMVAMDQCVGIGRETAQELEEKLREIQIQTHRLELRKLELMSRQ